MQNGRLLVNLLHKNKFSKVFSEHYVVAYEKV